jgi:MFS family permease
MAAARVPEPNRPAAYPLTLVIGRSVKRRVAFIAVIYFLQPWDSLGFNLLTGPFLLQRGYSLSNTLMVVGLATFGPSISTFITGLYIDRIERTTALALCGALSLAAVVVYGIAQGLYVPVMVTYGSEILPTRARASATSGAWAMNRTGSVLVPLSVIPAFHWGGGTGGGIDLHTLGRLDCASTARRIARNHGQRSCLTRKDL